MRSLAVLALALAEPGASSGMGACRCAQLQVCGHRLLRQGVTLTGW
jgi:hypothetical protein